MVGAVIAAGASIAGGVIASNGAKSAANTQAASADKAAQLAQDQYMQTRADQAPWRAAGETALSSLTGGLAPGGQFTKDFTMADYQADPGYAFRLSEGQKGIESAASARGSQYSGATLKALARFNSDQASQEYGAAYNRFTTNQSNDFNRLASVAGVGQTAVAQTASAGQAATQTAATAVQNAGTARASGYVGVGNAINGTLGTIANQYQLSQLAGNYGGTTNAQAAANTTAYYNQGAQSGNILY